MSEKTPYERLRELHRTLTERATTTVDADDREALSAALLVAELARFGWSPELKGAVQQFFGIRPPKKSALHRGWDAMDSGSIAFTIGLVALVAFAVLVFARLL
jgi:hypothetical protein